MTNEAACSHESPHGWVWTRVSEVYDIVGGGTPSTTIPEYWEGDIPWITSADLLGLKDIRPRRHITRQAVNRSATNLVPTRSLIVVTRVGLGKIGLTATPLCFSQDSQALVSKQTTLYPEYSLYYLSQAVQVFKYKHRGTTIDGVTKKQLAELPVAVPPLAEQQRIVAKIEELLTRLDAGVEALTKIKTQLKRYRQAILKHAFEGKLTAEWRQANEHQLEPASVLLESISQELHTSKGTKLVPLDTSDLPGLPGSWTWTNVSRIAHLVRGVSYPKEESSKEPRHGYIPILRANNIDRELNLRQLVYVPRKRVSDEQLVKSLDILIAMSSGSRDLVGKACQASRDLEAGFGAFCGIIRVVPDMDRTYVGFFFQSPSYRNQVSRLSSGVNINNLRRDHIESMPIPLPPLSEQRHIVEEIERRFSVADNIERTVDQGLKQADRLRQSILKRAFEGKLVPQDPNDEPAAKLLERIRAEKAEQQAGTKSIKAARKKATTEEMRLR